MKRSALVGGLLLLPLPVMFFALMVGRYPISPGEVFAALTGGEVAEVVRALVLRIRLPRIGAAALVGANLAVAGAVYQGVFRNPLVEGRLL
ncbi:MAG: iron chelate uptake ABC transporter family permease subunit, partial [Candidatus Bipolaricaulis sp.]|nr:iron chelate uptake ABC transporter family permease subunit [Candidatus Bipolaricaulis sp.]